ncbi:MAG: PAS domain-containing sensor histidine kinase, partial [Pseudomonadota bacterium]|nr:PAS domain-containing sensor histidine kinase [Pseudomonadota bacterium]
MNHQASFAVSSDSGRSMASLINGYDWKTHPLGPIATWPTALYNTVSMMLASRFPMYLAWGKAGYSLYNDGYIPILSTKHPSAIGASLEVVWGELAESIRGLIDLTYEDKSSYFEDTAVPLLRNGRLEQCYFTFSYSGIRGDNGEIEGFYSVCIETTHAYHAKQQRLSENARLSALFNQAPGFISSLSGPDHVFETANDAYRALVGQDRQLIGRSVRDALPEAVDQGFVELLDEVYRTGVAHIGRASRFDLERESGQGVVEMYVDFVYQPIFDGNHTVTGIMVQGHEVTEAHLARQALIDADRQKDQFIATLSHELRNPLAPIRTASRLLQIDDLPHAKVQQATAIISRQAEHMAKLLDDLLDVARIARNQIALERERISADAIISTAVETAKPLIDRKKHALTVHQQGAIELYVDHVRMTQAISNLLCNAAKYTDAGGKIDLRCTQQGDRCLI